MSMHFGIPNDGRIGNKGCAFRRLLTQSVSVRMVYIWKRLTTKP